MKPRIFVSSTFYDLKYIREDLSNFIKAHDFEPIMFEDGDIGYTPGKPLDDSCYETMKSADMVLLIIGGNYGSPASSEIKDEFKEYMSVTRNEFRSAVSSGIPLYVFIENKVYAEFEVYEVNFDKIENKKEDIAFKNTKNINVFRFIREIKSIGNFSIIEFSKSTQLKDFLSKQWSDMFKQYLDYLKQRESRQKVENTLDEMKTLIKKMNVMLDGVGKKVLSTDNSNEYEEVIELQNIVQLANIISKGLGLAEISITDTKEQRRNYVEKLLLALNNALESKILKKLYSENYEDKSLVFNYFEEMDIIIFAITVNLDKGLEAMSDIYRDKRARELLIDELIKDENYDNMCHVNEVYLDFEPVQE